MAKGEHRTTELCAIWYYGSAVVVKERGGTCSTHVEGEKRLHSFSEEAYKLCPLGT